MLGGGLRLLIITVKNSINSRHGQLNICEEEELICNCLYQFFRERLHAGWRPEAFANIVDYEEKNCVLISMS